MFGVAGGYHRLFAHRSYVIDMLDPKLLRKVITQEQPHLVVPEVEAIRTEILAEVEAERAALAAPIDKTALDLYSRIFTKKGDAGVSALENGICGGCHMKLPAKRATRPPRVA